MLQAGRSAASVQLALVLDAGGVAVLAADAGAGGEAPARDEVARRLHLGVDDIPPLMLLRSSAPGGGYAAAWLGADGTPVASDSRLVTVVMYTQRSEV